jgi:hypothetical protein
MFSFVVTGTHESGGVLDLDHDLHFERFEEAART